MTALIIALVINLIIVLLEVNASVNQVRHDGVWYFMYYTNLCNIFAGITSLLFVIFGLSFLISGSPIPTVITGLRFIAATDLMLTFIVVITILAPNCGKGGYKKMLIRYNAKYVHLICPILTIISFLFLEGGLPLSFGWTIIALIPTIIYGVIAVICNYKRTWDGPYGFLKVHDQTPLMSIVWGILILGGAYLIGLLLWYLNSIL